MKKYHYIGLDVHKRIIAYCVKNAAGKIIDEGSVAANRRELGAWASPDRGEKSIFRRTC